MAPKNTRFTSPLGTAGFPYLNSPDTKFKDEGEYKVNLYFHKDDPKWAAIHAELEALYEKNYKDQCAKEKKKELKKGDKPYKLIGPEGDDKGEWADHWKITPKMKALIPGKDGKEDIVLSPALFLQVRGAEGQIEFQKLDPKNQKCPKIGSGSKLKVVFEPSGFYTKLVGATLTLRLVAVQVVKLVQYSGVTADALGLEAEAMEEEETLEPDGSEGGDANDSAHGAEEF